MVITAVLTMITNLTHGQGQVVIVGKAGPAIAVRPQGLGGEEAGAADGGQAAGLPPLVGRSQALSRVLDHRQTRVGGDGVDGVQIRALTIEADRQDGPGTGAEGRRDPHRVQVVGARIDIDEDRPRPQQGNDLGGGDEGEGGGDNLVTRSDLQGHEGDEQGIRAGGHGNRVPDPDHGRQALLQFGDLGAHHIAAVAQDRLDTGLDIRLDAFVLGLEIDEIHGHASAGRGE